MSDEYVEYYAPLYFKAYKHGISKSYEVDLSEDKKIPVAYKNPDHYTVWCHQCACYMCYHNGPGTLMDITNARNAENASKKHHCTFDVIARSTKKNGRKNGKPKWQSWKTITIGIKEFIVIRRNS